MSTNSAITKLTGKQLVALVKKYNSPVDRWQRESLTADKYATMFTKYHRVGGALTIAGFTVGFFSKTKK